MAVIRRLAIAVALSLLVSGASASAQTTPYPDPAQRVLTHREQAVLVKGWIQKRFDTLLPTLMQRTGIDMWIIVSREYNDDPIFRSMAPLTTYSSRRRTILVFYNPGGGKPVERLSIGRFDYDGLFKVVQTHNDAQYEGLRKVVDERRPKVIGINESDAWNHADGLTANEKRRLVAALGPQNTAAPQVGGNARRWLARDEASRRARGVSPRDESRAPGDSRGVLEQGDHAWEDHQRGCRVVDAAAGRRDGTRKVVSAVGHDSSSGRRQARRAT